MTANMKMMMQRTKVRLPRAPMVLPMMKVNRFRLGHDLASLNTRNYNGKSKKKLLIVSIKYDVILVNSNVNWPAIFNSVCVLAYHWSFVLYDVIFKMNYQ